MIAGIISYRQSDLRESLSFGSIHYVVLFAIIKRRYILLHILSEQSQNPSARNNNASSNVCARVYAFAISFCLSGGGDISVEHFKGFWSAKIKEVERDISGMPFLGATHRARRFFFLTRNAKRCSAIHAVG